MAVFRKFGGLSSKLFLKNNAFFRISRNISDAESVKPVGLRPMMPGEIPETEEQRLKAAEKYNLHPDEYKPVADPDMCLGDYPDLPRVSADARDPYYPWDYPAFRRNYGEPVHEDFDAMTHDRYPYGVRQRIDPHEGALRCLLFFSFVILVWYYSPDTCPPVVEKQYPRSGQIHYTFNPAH